ncbi:hypothetical protein [Thalassospira xiamenensis]|uniref:Uncharacterized protein n=1 Tax=Thalassospira xiamenensis TaxID=220697 RepID=A0A285TI70_9PROT|nr:hypothetical protein [Thalassospira xiamenensis]SOC21682.1 hypothetical protein SAMN05428964_103466 [Thalassospira xiamenensis]
MASIRQYFMSRIGRNLSWKLTTGSNRFGDPSYRQYTIVVRGLHGLELLATVESSDYDANGNPISRSPQDHGVSKVNLELVYDAMDALEWLCRAADPKFFAKYNRDKVPDRTRKASEGIENRIAALHSNKDVPPPKPESLERFLAFWKEQKGVVLPALFTAEDGTVRARWQDGANKTLWISFPAKGQLSWSASVPRIGNHGLRKLSARCPDAQDILPLAELLGIGTALG